VKSCLPITKKNVDLKGEQIKGSFCEQELQISKQLFREEMVIRKRGDKALVSIA